MSQSSARINQARLAMMLLTRLPVGQIAGTVPPMEKARWAFPLVGLVIGAIGWGVFAGATALGLSNGIAASLSLLATILATGGMHYDGLADFADGWGGGTDRDRTLAIMRDSRIGSYGVLALILFCALLVLGIADAASGSAFMIASVGSRLSMLAGLIYLPPARTDGLGRMAAGRGAASLFPGGVLIAALALMGGAVAIVSLAGAAVVLVLIGQSALRRIGGQTGDVLGAIQVATETAIWIILAASAL